ncbi:hypothetical protein GCM10023350_44350 [Nocardioides endophyticus]|uniref:Uncharacterized protein n=1 Tax=Nocardioides endophyticus TaxID=1353775 RepID=A0ABP8ZED5_9ACTN
MRYADARASTTIGQESWGRRAPRTTCSQSGRGSGTDENHIRRFGAIDDHDQDSDPPTPFGEEQAVPGADSDEPGADPDPEPVDLE